jgi:hypothetical protein
MNKFSGPGDPDYDLVGGKIEEFLQKIREFQQQEFSGPDRECLDLLTQQMAKPGHEMDHIESRKEKLNSNLSSWILTHDEYLAWRIKEDASILRIIGDAGTGKTMLMMEVIKHHLVETDQGFMSYFFFEGTDIKSNNPSALFRGLIYQLIRNCRDLNLIAVLRDARNREGKGIFDQELALQSVLESMLAKAKPSILFVDALDECESGLNRILNFLHKTISKFGTKWLISSRPDNRIDQSLRLLDQERLRCLDLTPDFLSQYVDLYIEQRISVISRMQSYEDDVQGEITKQLRRKSAGIFLWVSHVCNELQTDEEFSDPLKLLEEIPPGLEGVYERVLSKIQGLAKWEACRVVLATAVIARRPLHLKELASIADYDQTIPTTHKIVENLAKLCQQFFTLQNNTVYFIHQSVKDYLQSEGKDALFPEGVSKRHQAVFSQSIKCLKALEKDIYSLKDPGIDIKDIRPPDVDPLLPLVYSCESWVDHLLASFSVPDGQSPNSKDELSDDGAVFGFLKKYFLRWLESLSLSHKLSDGVLSIRKLLEVCLLCL